MSGVRGGGGGRGAGTATPTPAPPLPTDHRQSSLHIHHPLSAHLPPDARRKKGVPKKGRKKRGRAAAPGENPPIEEGEEDEEEACDTETERSAEELRGGPAEGVQVGEARGAGPFLAVPRPSVQFFLQEDEVTERRAEEPPAPPAPPGPRRLLWRPFRAGPARLGPAAEGCGPAGWQRGVEGGLRR